MNKRRRYQLAALLLVVVAAGVSAYWLNRPTPPPVTSTRRDACIDSSYRTGNATSIFIQQRIVLKPYSYSDWLPYPNEFYWSAPPKDYALLNVNGYIKVNLQGNISVPIIVYSRDGQVGVIYGTGIFHEAQGTYWNYAKFRLGNPNPIPFEGNITYWITGTGTAASSPPNCVYYP